MRSSLRVATVFGTRPEAIKMAPVVRALNGDGAFEQTVIVTGQHREMLDQVLSLFSIVPDHDLALMAENQSLASLTARAVEALDPLFEVIAPDIVLVQGDTTTSFVAALAAFYRGAAVGHIEAGLRTRDLSQPWPEEGNRQLTSRLAAIHFAPTTGSQENLLREGIPAERVTVTGNTVIDALQWVSRQTVMDLASTDSDFRSLLGIPDLAPEVSHALEAVRAKQRRLVLITGHRRESFGDGFHGICSAIQRLAESYPDVLFVYPVHLNPNVGEPVRRALGESPNVVLLPPLAYRPFVALMGMSHIVLTDSGGIQEEAPGLGKPVLVMRDVTERPEGVTAGTVRLVGTRAEAIISGVSELLDNDASYTAMALARNPYGDGHASERIVARLKEFAASR